MCGLDLTFFAATPLPLQEKDMAAFCANCSSLAVIPRTLEQASSKLAAIRRLARHATTSQAAPRAAAAPPRPTTAPFASPVQVLLQKKLEAVAGVVS